MHRHRTALSSRIWYIFLFLFFSPRKKRGKRQFHIPCDIVLLISKLLCNLEIIGYTLYIHSNTVYSLFFFPEQYRYFSIKYSHQLLFTIIRLFPDYKIFTMTVDLVFIFSETRDFNFCDVLKALAFSPRAFRFPRRLAQKKNSITGAL